jgi:Tol biopolymer transport system component
VHLQRKKPFLLFLAMAFVIGGCTVPLAQPPASSTTIPPTAPVLDLAATQVPVTWSSLHLSGQLVYLAGSQQNANPFVTLESLDLASGVVNTLFSTPPLGWIYGSSVSPDEKQVVLAYAAPTAFAALFILPMDGSSPPSLLLPPPSKMDQYTEPVWSKDGKYIYFVHVAFGQQNGKQKLPAYEIERLAYPGGRPEMLLTNAYWPRLSPDGNRMVYVSQNPNDGSNQLFTASADGSNPKQVKLSGPAVFFIIDAPLFLADGKTILFSAPAPTVASAEDWMDWLLGVRPASAHNVISEWWSVAATGGTPTQLTHIQAPGLYGSVSPDGQQLASFSGNGIFVMRPDGSGMSMIVKDVGGIAGTVDWIR